jgi:alkanesulfonate monooxygenase SsuD/methylene tetrahydromethanopterin reductase-like flavin-dependent oxidoreductase (luciferase family)
MSTQQSAANKFRIWLFEFFPELKPAADAPRDTIARYFADYLDLWTQAEARGYHGIFFSEHHYGHSFSPSPNLLIAALAQRTKKLRLGVMGLVLPYYHPARVIEELGMLDQLTAGRLEIGTAVGVPQELARLRLTMNEARERNDEILDILDAAVRGPVGAHTGKHFGFEAGAFLPPFHQPSPNRWTTVLGPDSARKAARRGAKICTGFSSVDDVKAVFDAYLDEAARIGFAASSDHLGLRRRITVAHTESTARELTEAMTRRYLALVSQDPRLRTKEVPDSPNRGSGFSVSDEEWISGVPTQVADEIQRQCERTGAGHFLSILHWGAGLPEIAAAHQMFADEVMPRLHG